MDPRSCQAVPAVFLLVLLLGFGCAGPAPVDLKPQGSITVAVDPNRHRTVAKAQFLNEVVIRLPAPNPPDFVWQIAVHDSRYLRQLTKIKPAAEPGGETTVSFLAVLEGTTRIRFVLVEAAGRLEVDPVQLKEVELAIE